MGQKGGSTQQTSTASSSSPPPQVMAEYQGLVDRATNVANQPYQPYQGEQVAPLTSQTLQGLGGISQYANAAQPYLGAAAGMTMGASGAVNPEQFQGMGSLQNYMNPYTQSVVQATQGEMNNQNQQQAQFLNSANISSGAFGGDRAGIGQSILANQQQLAEAPTIAGLNQANYNQAMSNWQNQQGVNLAAQQANQARQMTGAAQLGSIGQSAQQAGLQGSQAQIQAGMIPQQEQQAIDTAAQNMYQTGQAYPFTTTGWLGNIIEGTGGLSGGSGSSTTTSPAPNTLSQGIGAGMQGLGILGSLFGLSDERAKENIEPVGKTYDGQNIYRYNFKGDPRTQIGLLAQEEAYRDPGNVKRIGIGDLLGVDYRGATDDAAERGHFAMGGAPGMGVAGMGAMGLGSLSGSGGGGSGGASPSSDLMMMGDPGARMGYGPMALMGGASAHPNPGFDTVPLRKGFQGGGIAAESPISYSSDPRQTSYGGWQPGDLVDPTSGVATSLYQQLTAGTKDPSYGLDLNQIEAIGEGGWMPSIGGTGGGLGTGGNLGPGGATASPQPDYQNLQNSPQFGAAEASLKGLFGPDYTPGQTPNQTPAATPAAAKAAAPAAPPQGHWAQTPGGQVTGGAAGAYSFNHGGGGGGTNVPGEMVWMPGMGGGGGGAMGRADGGRAGFQGGGMPMLNDPRYSYYTPTTGNARGATYNPPAQLPPAIAIQRQLQGKARATAAVQHGLVRPRVIAQDPTTGQHHDITPQRQQQQQTPQPQHPSTMRYPMWPTPGAAGGGPGAAGGPLDPKGMEAPPPRFGAKIPPEFTPPNQFGTKEPLRRPGFGPWGERGEPGRIGGIPNEETALPPPGQATVPESEFAGGEMPWWMKFGFRNTPLGRAISTGREVLRADPAETGELAPKDFPRNIGGPGMVGSGGPGRGPSGPPPDAPLDESWMSKPYGGHSTNYGPPKVIQAGPPQSHVTDLGTWDTEGGAPGRGDVEPTPRDPRAEAGWGDEGPVNYRWGGRIGRDDGGNVTDDPATRNMPWPSGGGSVHPQDGGDLSGLDLDQTFANLGDHAFDSGGGGGLSDIDWGQSNPANVPSRNAAPMSAQRIPPRSLSGGSGQAPFAIPISEMGGNTVTALNLGHYVPTTGNARGATYVPDPGGGGIDPRMRAQAPVHPAIAIARHIIRSRGGGGGGRAPGIVDPEIVARQKQYNSWVPPNEGYLGGENTPGSGVSTLFGSGGNLGATTTRHGTGRSVDPYADTGQWTGGRVGRQGGGGLMGSSPIGNAGAYSPQGFALDGQTSQGGGVGSFQTAKSAAGFGDMFGGGEREGFADGGDPFLAEIMASSPQSRGGSGPPPPPQAPKPPEPAGDGKPGGGPSDLMKQAGDLAKQFKTGVQGSPTGSTGGGGGGGGGGGWNDFGYSDADLGLGLALTGGGDIGFATGGGVGLGSLRSGFSDGGNAADAATDTALQQAFAPDVSAALHGSEPPAAAPAGGDVGSLINQHFGDRAGYASTISRLESSGGKSYIGDGGSSFGPFQLHYGGVNKDMPHPGLGDEFTKQTGLDARDPKTVPDQIKFVADYTAKHGWNDWSTKSQADKITGGGGTYQTGYLQQRDLPSSGAMPVSGTTEGYGGGFSIPPGGGQQTSQPPTLGSELRRDPFGYMMTVGAGMMASRSPWLGVGVGEGLEAGNKYLGQMQSLEKDWGLNQAQIQNLSAEAREHGADADIKVNQLQLQRQMTQLVINRMRQRLAGGGGDGAGAASPTDGSGTGVAPLPSVGPLPSGTGSGAAPSGGAGPSGAAPAPSGSAPAPAGGAPAGGAPAGGIAGADYTKDPDYIKGTALVQQGNDDNWLSKGMGDAEVTRGTELIEGAKNRGGISKEIGEKATEAVTEAQKPVYQKYLEDRTKFESTYDDTRNQLKELSDIYSHYQAGRSGEAQAELASWANALGLKLPQAAGFDAAMKTAVKQAFQQVADSGMQKAPRAGLREAMLMIAKPTMDPAALRKILTDSLASLDYNHELYNTVGSKQYDVSSGVTEFAKGHKWETYRDAARKEIPMFKGITPETLKTTTGEDMPTAPTLPSGMPEGSQYSPSRKQWRDPSGKLYDANGKPL
jgi:hypothetical protein